MAQINTNMITNQMNDFSLSLSNMENQMDLIIRSAKEMLNELAEGINCLDQSVANSAGAQIDTDELNALKAKMCENVYKECELLKSSLKTLIEIVIDGTGFMNKELQVRRKLMENPADFDMKELKKLLGEKADSKQSKAEDHPKYRELVSLIEDAKNGVSSSDGADLVVDEPVNQVVKCPITRKPIKDLARNKKCDHVYERSAILDYIKSRPNKKCPYAGCTQLIQLDK